MIVVFSLSPFTLSLSAVRNIRLLHDFAKGIFCDFLIVQIQMLFIAMGQQKSPPCENGHLKSSSENRGLFCGKSATYSFLKLVSHNKHTFYLIGSRVIAPMTEGKCKHYKRDSNFFNLFFVHTFERYQGVTLF